MRSRSTGRVPSPLPRRRRLALAFAVVVCGTVAAGCGPRSAVPDEGGTGVGAGSNAVAFENARLVVRDGSVIERGVLLIEGARIVAAGEGATVRVPDGTDRVDLSGHTIIPALIDAHAHLGYEGYEGWGAEFYSPETLEDHLDRYAYYGFGAIFSAGSDPDEVALDLQRGQREGIVGGARFLFGAGLAPPGRGPNDLFLEETRTVAARTGRPVVRGASTPGEARESVADIAARGIPFVKIWVDDRGGSQEKMPPEVYRAVIDEAHGRGLEVFVHQQSAADMPGLIAAGADGFLHGRLGPDLDAAIARQLADSGTFLVPNLGLGELRREPIGEDPFLRDAVRPDVAARLGSRAGSQPGPESRERELRAAFARLLDAGVVVVLGTDAGAVPDHPFGYTGHRELEIFVRLGMSPLEALVAGTGAAARALNLDDAGVLEAGRRADFVILEANPLEEIRNTRRIAEVYLGGERVERDALRAAWADPR